MLTAALLTAFAAGYALAFWHHRDERKWLRHELTVAHAQIAHAVIEDGAKVPPRIEPTPPQEPLSGALRDAIGEWEGAEAQANTEAKIRQWLAEGYGEPAILRLLGGAT